MSTKKKFDIGHAAFKWMKLNRYSVEEIAGFLGVDVPTLEREFNKCHSEKWVFPGVYLVGNQHLLIQEAMNQWKRVLVTGPPGSGKSVNSLEASKRLSKNLSRPQNLSQLEKTIRARFPGIILMDDADCMGKGYKEILELANDYDVMVIATASSDVKIPGYHTIAIKPPSPKEMEELAGVKGWQLKSGTNLTDAVKETTWGGGVAKVSEDAGLSGIGAVLTGKKIKEADKSTIEQVARNAIDIKSPEDMDRIMRVCAAAWKTLFAGGHPAPVLSTVGRTGVSSIFYRKSFFSEKDG